MLKLDYEKLYELSIEHPEKVWDELGKEVIWDKPYESVIEDVTAPISNWFVGGKINMSYNCLDIHVKNGFGDDIAVIYENPSMGISEKISFKELLNSVELLAGVMVNKCGIGKDDKVVLYFPVIPQCLIGMLACTRIGALYSVIYGGIPPQTIATRLEHMEPKLLITCNVATEGDRTVNYKERIDIAIDISKFKPTICLVYNRPKTQPALMKEFQDLDWETEMKSSIPVGHVPLESNYPMYVIYTSGTTGQPKGLVMATGNSVVICKYMMKYIKNIDPQKCWWMYSDFGWLTGQLFMAFGPLLQKNSTLLYEGTPELEQLFKFMNKHKVVSFYSSITFMRQLHYDSSDSIFQPEYDGLYSINAGGDKSDEILEKWITKTFKCPVYIQWGQTELGGHGMSGCLGFQRNDDPHSIPLLSINPFIVNNDSGEILPMGTQGRLLLKTPLPPSAAITYYKNHTRFFETYFKNYPGYYDTMDYGKIFKNGAFKVISRIDDVMKINSIRISGGAVEEVCLKNPNITNAIVVPMDCLIEGQNPIAFVTKRSGQELNDEEIKEDLINLVNSHIGEFARFRTVIIVPDFPRTINGKVSRSSLAAMINEKLYTMPPTIENPEIYREIFFILRNAGFHPTLPRDL